MPEIRKGRQTPTKSVVLPYTETYGQEAIDAWLKDIGIEYYNLMACSEVGFACYEKDGVYYWVCITRDGKLPLQTHFFIGIIYYNMLDNLEDEYEIY